VGAQPRWAGRSRGGVSASRPAHGGYRSLVTMRMSHSSIRPWLRIWRLRASSFVRPLRLLRLRSFRVAQCRPVARIPLPSGRFAAGRQGVGCGSRCAGLAAWAKRVRASTLPKNDRLSGRTDRSRRAPVAIVHQLLRRSGDPTRRASTTGLDRGFSPQERYAVTSVASVGTACVANRSPRHRRVTTGCGL
jgi:hypothetical protein